MFTTKELNQISSDYFVIFQKSSFAATIRSKCTGHDWHILYQEYGKFKQCEISHRHRPTDVFHHQCYASTLGNAVQIIQMHDTYHLRKRKRKRRFTRELNKR